MYQYCNGLSRDRARHLVVVLLQPRNWDTIPFPGILFEPGTGWYSETITTRAKMHIVVSCRDPVMAVRHGDTMTLSVTEALPIENVWVVLKIGTCFPMTRCFKTLVNHVGIIRACQGTYKTGQIMCYKLG